MKRRAGFSRDLHLQPSLHLSTYQIRLLRALVMILVITVSGTLGYHLLEGWSLLDALYMTIISMTTVGYGETRELTDLGRVFTMFLLISSIGTAGYSVSTLASFLVEGEFQLTQRHRRVTHGVGDAPPDRGQLFGRNVARHRADLAHGRGQP
jgi:hypothetical protein